MKKIVFLFLICFMTVCLSNLNVNATDSSFDFGDYEIVISTFQESNLRGFNIEKTGVNPFYKSVSNIGEYNYITDVIELNQYIFIFGYTFSLGSSTQYDSLLYIFDMNGTQMEKHIMDFGEMETIKNIYYIDDIYIAQTEQAIDQNEGFQFNANYFTAFDIDFNVVNDLKINFNISEIVCTDRYLLIKNQQSNEFDLAIRTDLSFFTKQDDLSIHDNDVFTKEFYLEFMNEGQLNDESIEHGIFIDYPGNYEFIYQNKTYHFILKATIFGVDNNQVYTQSVTPSVQKGNILINDDLFISGTELSKPGNYELIVIGVGDYVETINFVITHNLSGITNNQTYSESVLLTFTGDGYLNNQYIQSPFEVSDEGDYVLKIKGENNYLETYYFQIEDDDSHVTIVDFVQKFDIFILVVVVISGLIVLKKK